MGTRNDVVKSAANIVFRGMGIDKLELDTRGMYAPRAQETVVKNNWRALAKSMFLYEKMWGFMPWIRGRAEADCSVDPEWFRINESVRLRLAADGTPAADGTIVDPARPFLDQFVVPLIPAFGSYTVHTWRDKKTMQTHILCLPNADLSGDAEPIQTLVFDELNIPVCVGSRASLRSSLASLIEPYARLGQFKKFATTAAFALARPVVFVEIDHKDLDMKVGFLLFHPKRLTKKRMCTLKESTATGFSTMLQTPRPTSIPRQARLPSPRKSRRISKRRKTHSPCRPPG